MIDKNWTPAGHAPPNDPAEGDEVFRCKLHPDNPPFTDYEGCTACHYGDEPGPVTPDPKDREQERASWALYDAREAGYERLCLKCLRGFNGETCPKCAPVRGSEEVEALEDAIAGSVGRNWCSVCESYDHDCGCDPDVNRRKLADVLALLRTALRSRAEPEGEAREYGDRVRRDHEAMEALRNGVAGQVWYGGLRASTPGSTKWHAERHDTAMTTADDPADAILATPTGEEP